MEKQYATKLDAYDAEITPLVEQVHALCEKHGINMVQVFQLDDDKEQTKFSRSQHYDQNNLQDVAPELMAMTVIANEDTGLAVGILRAVASRREHQSAAANPHGVAE